MISTKRDIMWKEKLRKKSGEQRLRMDALDFATKILDRIEQDFEKKNIGLPKNRLLEFRQTLRELFLEAADLE